MSAFSGLLGGFLTIAQAQAVATAESAGLLGPTAIEESAGERRAGGPRLEMRYAGLTPGGGGKSPLPLPKGKPAQLVWTGFRMNADRAEVFVQTTHPVEFELAASASDPRRLAIVLRRCRIHRRNNARKLDTRFFSGPVAEVTARQRRRDVELSIGLKEEARIEPRTEEGPDGTHLLVLALPGAPRAAAEPEPVAPSLGPVPLAPGPSVAPSGGQP